MQKEPTLESFIDFSPENTFIDPFVGRQFEKYLNHVGKADRKQLHAERWRELTRWQKIRKGLAVAASIMVPLTAGNALDIYQNYEQDISAHVSLSYEAPALNPDNNDTAIVVLNGYNSTSAEPIMEPIGSGTQQGIDGQEVDVHYNNAQLSSGSYLGKNEQLGIHNINEISDQLREYFEKNGIKYYVIVTYSLGCVPGTEVAENLTKNQKSGPLLKAIIYVSCPTKFADLQNRPQNEVSFVEFVNQWIPFATDSSYVDLAGRIYFIIEEYEDGDPLKTFENAPSIIKNSFKAMDAEDATSPSALFDQGKLITQVDFPSSLHSIAINTSDSLTPEVLDTRTGPSAANPYNYDTVVNDKLAGPDMIHAAQKAPLPYMSLSVPGVVHGEPEKSSKEFKQTFAAAKVAIQQALSLQEEIYTVKQIQDLSRQPITRIQE